MNTFDENKALAEFDKMAIKIARKYSNYLEFDDLYQIGKISIIEAVRNYDASKGAKLSTHVYNTILFNIKKVNFKQKNSIDSDIDIYELEYVLCDSNDDFTKDVDLSEIINKILLDLTDKQKKIIFMKYIEGYTINEIAKIHGCSHQNISSICKNAEKTINQNIFTQGLSYEMLI